MKYFLISFVLLLLFAQNSFSITISEAVKQKLISLTVQSYDGKRDSVYNPSYYGACIVFKVKNLKTTSIQLTEDAGRFLMPADSDEQRMVITSAVSFALLPNQQKSVPVFAMCTEAHDAGPSDQTRFSYGQMSNGNLLSLVQMIAKNNFQDNTAQYAVWCITDNYSPNNIRSEDSIEATKLGKYVCELKHIPYEPGKYEEDIRLPHSAQVRGNFHYSIEREHTIDLRIYNEQNQLVKDIVHGEKQMPGTYTYSYEADIPVNDDRHPPAMIIKFYFDGKVVTEKRHTLQNY